MSRVRSAAASLGFEDRETVAWALYDWANSGFATVAITAVLPLYYATYVVTSGPASRYWALATALGLGVVAVTSPVVGAVADHLGAKTRLLAAFVGLGVVANTVTYLVLATGPLRVAGLSLSEVWLVPALFVLANVGFAGANALYDSLLPHVTDQGGMDRLSAAGYAIGYLGGGILLVANLAVILSPATFGVLFRRVAMQYAVLSVSVWWLLFSVPVLLFVDEPDPQPLPGAEDTAAPVAAFQRLRETFAEIRQYKQLTLFLVAFWLYADGIGSIIRLASVYASDVGLGQTGVIGALVVTQFAGIPFAFAFGKLADRVSALRAIYLGLVVYVGIVVGGFFLTTQWQFWLLAFMVATVQGGTQALSRSLFGSMVPDGKSSEFFGFFSVSSKFAGIFGPLAFATTGDLLVRAGLVADPTAATRYSLLVLVVFFLGGLAVLTRVDVEAGRAVARRVERDLEDAPSTAPDPTADPSD